jgi:hypothetical protein
VQALLSSSLALNAISSDETDKTSQNTSKHLFIFFFFFFFFLQKNKLIFIFILRGTNVPLEPLLEGKLLFRAYAPSEARRSVVTKWLRRAKRGE